MPRFFVDKDQIDGSSLRITGDDARHIARSLRMAEGDETAKFLAVFVEGGDGNWYLYSVGSTNIG